MDNQGTRTVGNQVQKKINILERKKKAQARETRKEKSTRWRSDVERSGGTSQKDITCKTPGQNIGTTQAKTKGERETKRKDTVTTKENNDEDRSTLEKKGGLGKNSWGLSPGNERGGLGANSWGLSLELEEEVKRQRNRWRTSGSPSRKGGRGAS